jgi:predicted bacteriocin transport accessory protein
MDNKETFIVYFGFSTCPWCRSIIEELIKCAKDSKVDKIYYVDVLDIRDTKEIDEEGNIKTTKEGTKGYKELIDKMSNVLSDYTTTTEEGEEISLEEKRIYAPNVIAVVNGKATKLEEGISEELKDPYMELTEEMKKYTYNSFKCIFKCLEEAETVCTSKAC